jgi:hypothetical protein
LKNARSQLLGIWSVIEGCDRGYRAYSEMFVVFLSSKKVPKLVEDGCCEKVAKEEPTFI